MFGRYTGAWAALAGYSGLHAAPAAPEPGVWTPGAKRGVGSLPSSRFIYSDMHMTVETMPLKESS